MIPYALMALLFAALATLVALDASLTSYSLLPWLDGLRWLRVHFITLGVMVEAMFGFLPLVLALRAGRARPATRWDIWLALNGGLVILLVGIPMVSGILIVAGGTLVFVATVLLFLQLAALSPRSEEGSGELVSSQGSSRRFYLMGLAYLMLGILVGTGLWLGWGDLLRISTPVEVHIHANNWGFIAFLFAGLLVDLMPHITGRPLASPRSLALIFGLMSLGALGLVLGPWLNSRLFTIPGILFHTTATLWILARLVTSAREHPGIWGRPGIWHLLTSYVWILAPIVVAPLILLGVPGFPGAGIEANAPQALIYGWVLQFGYAILPFLAARFLLPREGAELGGSWFSLAAVHLGGLLLWASIFNAPYQGLLHGSAYLAWFLSMLPLVHQLWRISRRSLQQFDQQELPLSRDAVTAD